MKRYIVSNTAAPEIDSEGNIVPPDIASALANSKIRNRKHQLIVCYHGTNADFQDLKEELISTNSGNVGWFGRGFYFTDVAKLASDYGAKLKKCYLNITNPFVYSSKDAAWDLLLLGVSPRSDGGEHLLPYAYMDDPTPAITFTEAIKKAGYDGVKYSYKQANYRPNISGVGNASEFVCFRNDQVVWIQ